jgi:hypothetical protein
VALESEDFARLHVTGTYAKVAAALAVAGSGGGFRIVPDQGRCRASLAPSAALTLLCPESDRPLPSASCLLRYDIRSRTEAPGLVHEVVSWQAAAAAAFMQGLVGGSAHAASLGLNISTLLPDRYQVGAPGRALHALWISPAVNYAPAEAAGRVRFQVGRSRQVRRAPPASAPPPPGRRPAAVAPPPRSSGLASETPWRRGSACRGTGCRSGASDCS